MARNKLSPQDLQEIRNLAAQWGKIVAPGRIRDEQKERQWRRWINQWRAGRAGRQSQATNKARGRRVPKRCASG
jgi:hypothetical protein